LASFIRLNPHGLMAIHQKKQFQGSVALLAQPESPNGASPSLQATKLYRESLMKLAIKQVIIIAATLFIATVLYVFIKNSEIKNDYYLYTPTTIEEYTYVENPMALTPEYQGRLRSFTAVIYFGRKTITLFNPIDFRWAENAIVLLPLHFGFWLFVPIIRHKVLGYVFVGVIILAGVILSIMSKRK
jgi:hypothetical protein